MNEKPEITSKHAHAVLRAAYETLEDGNSADALTLLQAAYYLLFEAVGK